MTKFKAGDGGGTILVDPDGLELVEHRTPGLCSDINESMTLKDVKEILEEIKKIEGMVKLAEEEVSMVKDQTAQRKKELIRILESLGMRLC